jgi:type I restriction enzyme, R subunit
MPIDTSEKGLESLIEADMRAGGWQRGNPGDYHAEYALDLAQLAAFLRATQPKVAAALDLENDSPTRRSFLARLQGEITNRGVIDVLRKGIRHQAHSIELYYVTPSPDNAKAVVLHGQNRFSLTRQVHYSTGAPLLSLDMVAFVNGLPVITFELKNSLTKHPAVPAGS